MLNYMATIQIGICMILVIFSFITNSLSKKRKQILFAMAVATMMLVLSEQFARNYNGDTSTTGFFITRIGKFFHYELNLANIYIFSLYLKDMLKVDGNLKKTPESLIINDFVLLSGVITVVISQFTGIYYFYDSTNLYHRGVLYGISYVYSSIAIVILAANIIKYRKIFSKKLFWPFLMFTLAPMVASIIHLFIREISLVNAAIVAMMVLLYCFSIVDANEAMETAREKEMTNVKLMMAQTASALAEAIDAKDTYTSGHSRRVAEYSAKIAETYGKDKEYCEEIYLIGLLHDVGKIGVPGTIINKTEKLTDEEYEIIKTHTTKGKEILSKISISPDLPIGANYHHERYDGKGYPEGLKGEEIPEIARIIAVADTYDAMASKRSYRDGLPRERIRHELIQGMGTQFDSKFASVMVDLMDQKLV